MPSWREYHSIALLLGTVLQIIVCVYRQFPCGNSSLAKLKASQIEEWRILYPMTSIACAFSTARCVGSRVGLLHIGTTRELLCLLWDARRLSCKSGMWCKSNAWCCKLSSPRVLHLLSRLVVYEVPSGSARWRLDRVVFVNQQNTGY